MQLERCCSLREGLPPFFMLQGGKHAEISHVMTAGKVILQEECVFECSQKYYVNLSASFMDQLTADRFNVFLCFKNASVINSNN